MLDREAWKELACKLDWTYSYATEREIFPEEVSGRPWLPHAAWQDWDEPYKTSYSQYVAGQCDKETAVHAVRDALGHARTDPGWSSGVKLHTATLPLAEFAAVVGNLRAARFGRDGSWRNAALFGAMDECRHTQLPLLLMHELVRQDPQYDWTHRFYHSNNWVAIAGRHLVDELLLCADPVELALATNFVFETGFTNLQFIGLSALAARVNDPLFRTMIASIQTDEARHSQIGHSVLPTIVAHDRAYAQALLDKWFWRSWHLFAVITGFVTDYLTPVASRTCSFKELMEEWVVDQYAATLRRFGLELPWYWEHFLSSLDYYHHMVYASAYSYRSTVWFDLVLPGPDERAWLREKYPRSAPAFEPIWTRLSERWQRADPGLDLAVHGTAIIGFCSMCQIVLCGGTPEHNTASTLEHEGRKYVFCSPPCRWIFEREPARYASHKDLVQRVLAGEAPGNLVALLHQYFGMGLEAWGRDVFRGKYPWLERKPREAAP